MLLHVRTLSRLRAHVNIRRRGHLQCNAAAVPSPQEFTITQSRYVTFALEPIEGADKIALAKIDGTEWQCVTAKDQWEGRKLEGVYIGIDSLLDVSLEPFAFLKDKATKAFADGRPAHRLKTIRLRKVLSQGLLIPVPGSVLELASSYEEKDWDSILGIERYEPPPPRYASSENIIYVPDEFARYHSIENAKNHPGAFHDGERVVVTEKVHGSNFRVGIVRFGDSESSRYCVGTHRTVRDPAGDNLYSRTAAKFLPEEPMYKAALEVGAHWQFIVFAEVFGSGIQDLEYGCAKGEQAVRIFDVMVDGRFIEHAQVKEVARSLGVEMVPVLYDGPYSREAVRALRDGSTTFAGAKHVREGVVVKAAPERDGGTHKLPGRMILKYVSDAYLERSGAKDGH